MGVLKRIEKAIDENRIQQHIDIVGFKDTDAKKKYSEPIANKFKINYSIKKQIDELEPGKIEKPRKQNIETKRNKQKEGR